MKEIGELYISGAMKIFENDDGEYLVQKEDGSLLPLTGEEAYAYLCKPWSEVCTYTDENGIHWKSIVYDSIWIDIWAPDLKQLFNRVVNMLTFTEETEDFMCNQVEKLSKKESD